MRRLVLALVAVGLASNAEAATLKIAAIGEVSGPCAPPAAEAPAGEKAYFTLLQERLGRDVLKCPVVDRVEAARALADGKVDLAVLDQAAFEPVKLTTRPILTVRPKGGLHRIPILVMTKASKAAPNLASLKGTTAVFGGQSAAALAMPRRTLADQGLGPGFFAHESVAADTDAAAKELRAGAADAMVINASAWQRLCRGDKPGEDRCRDLKTVWRGRPRAPLAVVIRRDMPDELRFRLIGIHVAMHVEAKPAFAWASSWIAGGAEFEPTEAEALTVTSR